MAPTLSPPAPAPVVTAVAAPRLPACGACAHGLDHHDVIALRYCTATVAGALTRGCICPPD